MVLCSVPKLSDECQKKKSLTSFLSTILYYSHANKNNDMGH